jgi:hypothetical protein
MDRFDGRCSALYRFAGAAGTTRGNMEFIELTLNSQS